MSLIKLEALEGVLQEYGNEVRNLYQDRLILHGHIATGNLLNKVEAVVEVNGTKYEVSLDHLEEYWKWVEYDTKPHWPPRDAILNWIRVKPIIPRPDNRGRIPTPESLAFLIGRAMAGKSPNQLNLKNPFGGTTGTHELEDAIADLNAKYKDKIIYALTEDGESLARVIAIQLKGDLQM